MKRAALPIIALLLTGCSKPEGWLAPLIRLEPAAVEVEISKTEAATFEMAVEPEEGLAGVVGTEAQIKITGSPDFVFAGPGLVSAGESFAVYIKPKKQVVPGTYEFEVSATGPYNSDVSTVKMEIRNE